MAQKLQTMGLCPSALASGSPSPTLCPRSSHVTWCVAGRFPSPLHQGSDQPCDACSKDCHGHSYPKQPNLKWAGLQADLRILQDGKIKTVTVQLLVQQRLIPVHIKGRPPPYFIVAGLVFTQVRPGLGEYLTLSDGAWCTPSCLCCL